MRIAIAGHRDVKDEVVKQVIRDIASKKDVPLTILQGMAMGCDMAAAEQALEMDLQVEAYIPCLGQQHRWESDQQKRYFSILAHKNTKIIYTSKKAWTKGCYFHRNATMSKAKPDLLVAFMRTEDSGTGHCVGRFRIEGVKVHIFHPEQHIWK